MDDDQFSTFLGIVIVPRVVDFIMGETELTSEEAINAFYRSKTYDLLSVKDSWLWHYSALTLFHMWESERDTGCIVFPEEC